MIRQLSICLLLPVYSLAQIDPPAVKADGSVANYQPISGPERFNWFAVSTVGPRSLVTGVFSAGWSTMNNSPEEYGPHWEGFGKRYGMRLTGVSVGNAMEASLGAAWGEDPRYFRASGQPFKRRVVHVLKSAFVAYDREGRPRPAYARYIAVPGNNFLSNTWRVESHSSAGEATFRTAIGFLGRMTGNAFTEFLPDVRKLISRKRVPGTP